MNTGTVIVTFRLETVTKLLLLTWGGEAGEPPYRWAAVQPGTARTTTADLGRWGWRASLQMGCCSARDSQNYYCWPGEVGLEGLPTDGLLLSQGQPELLLLTWGGEAGGPPYVEYGVFLCQWSVLFSSSQRAGTPRPQQKKTACR